MSNTFALIETRTNSHDLIQMQDGSYRLACTPDAEKLPKGKMFEAGSAYQARDWNSATESFVPRVDADGQPVMIARTPVCNRCNGSRGSMGR
jgi:hypothetical protein